ncbi:MAG: ABC transporter permease [Bdellovibrionales bacterium]|nr:ABC transporter permease [Bdellovibrionales bacterium]
MKQKLATGLEGFFTFPSFGYGAFAVWMRNYLYFKYTIWVSILWLFVEPVLYLLAFGYGLGKYIDQVNGQPYIEFFYPGLMIGSAMLVSFYEGTYGCYTKLARQNTFITILQTPVLGPEIAVGEILWACSKGLLSGLAIGLIGVVQGFFSIIELVTLIPVIIATCFLFSSFSVGLAATAKNYDWFMYAQTAFIIPMYLFSGTYFPLESLPMQIQQLAWCFPLTHSVYLVRQILVGEISTLGLISISYLTIVNLVIFNLAVFRFNKKLVV